MKKIVLIISIFATTLGLNPVFAQQIKVSGVKLPTKIGFSGTIRELNGAGTRVKYMLHVYVAGLYLKEKSHDAKKIINADKPMSVRLQIISAMLTGETMVRYIREGFSRSMHGNASSYKNELDLICDIFLAEPTKVGDVYDIHFTPGVGISASKNGKALEFKPLKSKIASSEKSTQKMQKLNYTKDGQAALPGLDFKKALFGIWLSDDPVDEDLKDEMLGIEAK